MTVPQTSSGIGNLLRLQGLKNVSGRRKVLPGAEFLQDLNNVDTDVAGTAGENYTPNYTPMPQNIPEADMGGELGPQSYDVRANQVMSPEAPQQEAPPEEGESMWSRFGRALAMQSQMGGIPSKGVAQTPPIETQQVDLQEGLPPVSASQEESQPGALAKFGKWAKDNFTPKLGPEFAQQFPDVAQEMPQFQGQTQGQQQLDQAELDKAQQEPWQIAVYGATDSFANRPELVQEFQQYTGIDFSPQTKELTEKYEKVISDIEKGVSSQAQGYDEQAQRIQERILANQATDVDKYYIGLALLMPLLVGGIFGKEAGLGALAGGAKGIADIYGRRGKDIMADEELLSGINKQKGDLSLKKGDIEIQKLKIPSEVAQMMPKDEYEDLKGMNMVSFKDPATGEVIGGGPEILPDLVENLSFYNTPKKRDEAGKKAAKLSEEKAALQRANDATRDVIDAAMQLKDPGLFGKMLAIGLSSDEDGKLKKLYKQNAPMITVEGRKVNSAVYLDTKLEQIKDAYRRNEQMRAFTNTIANHVGAMAENPQYSGLKPDDLVTQMLVLRDRGQQFFTDRAVGQGFYEEPLVNLFGKQNRELYKKLNRREERSAIESDKQKMFQSE